MKKLLFIIALFVSFTSCVPASIGMATTSPFSKNGDFKTDGAKLDTPKCKDSIPVQVVEVVNGLIESIPDSLDRADAVAVFENAQKSWYNWPVKGSSYWTWIKWYMGLFLLLGIITGWISRYVPTEYKNKYKWLRWTETIFTVIMAIVKLVPNRKKEGGIISKHEE